MAINRLIIFFALAFSFSSYAEALYPVGEKFEFQAYALGVIPIGKVWMDTGTGFYNNLPTYQFHARCYGDYIFYLADVHVTSDLSKDTDQSLYHTVEQYGSERRGRRLTFDWVSNHVRYVRYEIDGKYRHRRTTPITPDVWDVLGCAFRARRIFNTELGSSTEIKCIEKTRVFHLRCTVVERRPFKVKGIGIFDAVRVTISAINLQPQEIFKGLLELDKDIVLWIDVSTGTPLFMSTKVPFGIFKPTIKLVMKKWDTVAGFEPKLLPASALKKHVSRNDASNK